MERRTFIAVVSGGLLAAPLAAEAQPTPTVRRIGVVGGAPPEHVEARKEGLRRLGWVEGQNIVVEGLELGTEVAHDCWNSPETSFASRSKSSWQPPTCPSTLRRRRPR
jgi:hypothetical protein